MKNLNILQSLENQTKEINYVPIKFDEILIVMDDAFLARLHGIKFWLKFSDVFEEHKKYITYKDQDVAVLFNEQALIDIGALHG